jgi:hypothetical protein
MKLETYRMRGLLALCSLGMLLIATAAWAAPKADRVSPQRMTVFVGQGEYRVQIEGSELNSVNTVVAVDTSQTGYEKEAPEVTVRILNKTSNAMTVVIRADSAPGNGSRMQLRLVYGHQGYLIPSGLFQFEVR